MKALFKNKVIEVIVEIIILVFGSYLLAQRITGFSLTEFASRVIHSEVLNAMAPSTKIVFGSIFAVAIVFKMGYLIRDKFQLTKFDNEDPGSFVEVIALFQKSNSDLKNKITGSTCCCRADIKNPAQFIALSKGVSRNLIDFIATGFGEAKFKRRDIFVSVYEYVNTDLGPALIHLFHEDDRRYEITSKRMLINGKEHEAYECVRAVKDERNITVKLAAKELKIVGRKRHKSMTHYIGAPLKVEGEIVGFLNLEFHHKSYFSKEDELEDFAKTYFLPFQMLLEQAFGKWQLNTAVEQKCGCNNVVTL